MEYKDIYNKNLEKKINSALRRVKIHPALRKMMPEIFLRRAYELELTPTELEKELNRFKKNTKRIDFKGKYEFQSETIMGVCNYKAKQIIINRDYFAKLLYNGMSIEEVSQRIFGTLTHEVNHSATVGLRYCEKDNVYGTALDEVVTETTANRNCLSKDAYVAKHYRAETDGYGDITFASNIFAATFGMSEKEFLKFANKGRKVLINEIRKKSNNPERSQNYFNAIEQNLDILYNVNYKPEEFDYMSAIDIRKQALDGIFSYSIAELTSRLQDEPVRYGAESSFITSDYRYNRNKIKVIIDDTIQKYVKLGIITPDSKDSIMSHINILDNDLQTRITDTISVEKAAFNLDRESYEFAYKMAKNGNIRQYAYMYRNIPQLGKDLSTMPRLEDVTESIQYESFLIKEEYDGGKQWNNHEIINNSLRKIYQDLTTESIYAKSEEKTLEINEVTQPVSIYKRGINAIRDFFVRLKNRNMSALPSASNKVNDKVEYIEPEDKLSQYIIDGKALYDPELRNSMGATKESYRKGTEKSEDSQDEYR